MTDAEFEAVFDQHKDAVYRFAWRMAGPAAAEDIAQEVFLVFLRQPGRFDPGRGSLRSFLLGIARNLALKQWRDAHRWEEMDDEQLVAPPFDIGRAEIGELVAAAVRSLPPLQREVLILAHQCQPLGVHHRRRRSCGVHDEWLRVLATTVLSDTRLSRAFHFHEPRRHGGSSKGLLRVSASPWFVSEDS